MSSVYIYLSISYEPTSISHLYNCDGSYSMQHQQMLAQQEEEKWMLVVHESMMKALYSWELWIYFVSALQCIFYSSYSVFFSFSFLYSSTLSFTRSDFLYHFSFLFSLMFGVASLRLNIKSKSVKKSDGIFFVQKYYKFPFSIGQRAFIKIKRQKVNIARRLLRAIEHWDCLKFHTEIAAVDATAAAAAAAVYCINVFWHFCLFTFFSLDPHLIFRIMQMGFDSFCPIESNKIPSACLAKLVWSIG